MILKTFNLTFLIAYCSFIYWLSSQPSVPAPMMFDHQDKLYHFAAYFIMGVLSWRFFFGLLAIHPMTLLLSICFGVLYGASDEWHQSFVPGRDASLLDWVADSLGAMAGSVVTKFSYKIKRFGL